MNYIIISFSILLLIYFTTFFRPNKEKKSSNFLTENSKNTIPINNLLYSENKIEDDEWKVRPASVRTNPTRNIYVEHEETYKKVLADDIEFGDVVKDSLQIQVSKEEKLSNNSSFSQENNTLSDESSFEIGVPKNNTLLDNLSFEIDSSKDSLFEIDASKNESFEINVPKDSFFEIDASENNGSLDDSPFEIDTSKNDHLLSQSDEIIEELSSEINANEKDGSTDQIAEQKFNQQFDEFTQEKSPKSISIKNIKAWSPQVGLSEQNKWLEEDNMDIIDSKNLAKKETDSSIKDENKSQTTGRFNHGFVGKKKIGTHSHFDKILNEVKNEDELEDEFENELERNLENIDLDALGINEDLDEINDLKKSLYNEDDMLNEFSQKMSYKIPSSSFQTNTPSRSNSFSESDRFELPKLKDLGLEEIKNKIDNVLKNLPDLENLSMDPKTPTVEKLWLVDEKKNYGQSDVINKWRKQLGLRNFNDM